MSVWSSLAKLIGIGQPITTAVNADVTNINKALGFLKPLGPEFAALHAAWTAKDFQAELAAGLPIAEAFLNVAGMVFPEATVAAKGLEVLGIIVPLLVPALIKLGSGGIPDGHGGTVPAKGWPLLDKDGNFTGKYS